MLGVDFAGWALAQFKGSEGSPRLFQDFEGGYIKVYDSPSHHTESRT